MSASARCSGRLQRVLDFHAFNRCARRVLGHRLLQIVDEVTGVDLRVAVTAMVRRNIGRPLTLPNDQSILAPISTSRTVSGRKEKAELLGSPTVTATMLKPPLL